MPARRPTRARQRIIDAALTLAEEHGWDNVRLYQVAARADLPLAAVQAEFGDLDAIANAWFERALEAVAAIPAEALAGRPPPERLRIVMLSSLDALAAHRSVAGQMLRAKLHLPHAHHWVPLVFDLSRLIHWFLDAARIASRGRQRQLAEIGLTAIFLATLHAWLRDDGAKRAPRVLERCLAAADGWVVRLAP